MGAAAARDRLRSGAKALKGFQSDLSGLQPQQQAFGNVTQRALGAFGSYDPMQAAKDLFGQFQDIVGPYQQQQRDQQQAQLLRQGRLGSTGGGIQQQALENSLQQANQQGLYNAFGQAQQAQQNLLGLAQGAFSPQLNYMGLQSQTPGMWQGLGQAFGGVGGSGLGRSLGTLGGAFLGSMAGPLGASLGGQLGGSLFGTPGTTTPITSSSGAFSPQAAMSGNPTMAFGNLNLGAW